MITLPTLFLIALFFLTIGHLVTLKVCSVTLNHKTAPIFLSSWTLIGMLVMWPTHGYLFHQGLQKLSVAPHLFLLIVLKGIALYFLFVISQGLMQVSLSSRHYVTPLSVGLIAIINSFLGETLTPGQWMAALGLCLLSAVFFFKGHLADIGKSGRIAYGQLVALAVVLAAFDHVLTRDANWFTLLFISNITLLITSLVLHGKDRNLLHAAAFSKSAILAGIFYAATELTKFYQQVTINPVSVVITVQAMTKPLILVLSALIWKERTVKEQLLWGILAFIVILPLFF